MRHPGPSQPLINDAFAHPPQNARAIFGKRAGVDRAFLACSAGGPPGAELHPVGHRPSLTLATTASPVISPMTWENGWDFGIDRNASGPYSVRLGVFQKVPEHKFFSWDYRSEQRTSASKGEGFRLSVPPVSMRESQASDIAQFDASIQHSLGEQRAGKVKPGLVLILNSQGHVDALRSMPSQQAHVRDHARHQDSGKARKVGGIRKNLQLGFSGGSMMPPVIQCNGKIRITDGNPRRLGDRMIQGKVSRFEPTQLLLYFPASRVPAIMKSIGTMIQRPHYDLMAHACSNLKAAEGDLPSKLQSIQGICHSKGFSRTIAMTKHEWTSGCEMRLRDGGRSRIHITVHVRGRTAWLTGIWGDSKYRRHVELSELRTESLRIIESTAVTAPCTVVEGGVQSWRGNGTNTSPITCIVNENQIWTNLDKRYLHMFPGIGSNRADSAKYPN
ncbi:hypothetical protein C8R44DRAFT_740910 [Mycena epipterygia]|nr:hypothetical protein C8R44DRAFT_740910 [Mycena epipterygia]